MDLTVFKARFGATVLCWIMVVVMLTSQSEERGVRSRRQECSVGTFEYGGRTCCMCPAGSKIQEYCTDQFQTKCEPCVAGKEYQSYGNMMKTCEPCTSCEQPNANVEVDRPCTPLADSTCKCKENHYCPSDAKPCRICEPCDECDSEGIKEACTATNNTICNDKSQDNSVNLGVAIGVPVIIVFLVAAGVAFYLMKKRKSASNDSTAGIQEIVPLQDPVNLGPHIPEIADVIGWQTMRNLATYSNIPPGRIESCEQDHANDSTERTIALMKIWEQKESRNASRKLDQYLRQKHQNTKADQVQKILHG